MKRFESRWAAITLVTAVGAAASLPAMAGHDRGPRDDVYYDRVRVLDVEPVYDVVQTPVEHRECWREEHSRVRRDGGASMVAGSIIGGVLGHQVGDGDGRKVATVAGTIIGAAVGREMGREAAARPRVEQERHCRVTDELVEEEYLRGYHVTYQYQGRHFTTFMDEHPGKFLHVQVGVAPVLD